MLGVNIQSYIAKLKTKYKVGPPLQHRLGYPENYKDLGTKIQVKYQIGEIRPTLFNYGDNSNDSFKSSLTALDEENELIQVLIAPWGGNKQNTWAYVTSGGTEGNIAGFKFGINAFTYYTKPILLFSSEAHHSVSKAIELTKECFQARLQIPTQRNGEIDYKQMIPAVKYIIGQKPSPQDIPPFIVIATLGTTMKGACDNIALILDTLYSIGLTREKIFIHVDAAFHGGFWHLDEQNPKYKIGVDFNSIAISGWKWHGADVCGLFALYQQDTELLNKGFINYIRTQDNGVTSSRDGFHPITWMVRILQFDWQEEYNLCRKNVQFAKRRFDQFGIPTLINPASLTICIPKLPECIVKKYFIACYTDAHLGEMCHIIICPHVTQDIFFGC